MTVKYGPFGTRSTISGGSRLLTANNARPTPVIMGTDS